MGKIKCIEKHEKRMYKVLEGVGKYKYQIESTIWTNFYIIYPKYENMLNSVLQLMEDGENSVIGRNVRFLVEVENKKESVHATVLLQRMAAMTAQLTDQAVLKPENVTKISVQVSDFEINEYFH